MEEDGAGETVIDNNHCRTLETCASTPEWEDEMHSAGAETNPMPSTSQATNAGENGKEPASGEPKDPQMNPLVSVKFWLQVKLDLPKVILNFAEDVVDNIVTCSQLYDLALKCDIPSHWVERAREDYGPHETKMIN